MSSLESLKDELRLVAEKKSELEKRLQACVRERDALNAALEEASDRIHSLERHAREQETKLQVRWFVLLRGGALCAVTVNNSLGAWDAWKTESPFWRFLSTRKHHLSVHRGGEWSRRWVNWTIKCGGVSL